MIVPFCFNENQFVIFDSSEGIVSLDQCSLTWSTVKSPRTDSACENHGRLNRGIVKGQ